MAGQRNVFNWTGRRDHFGAGLRLFSKSDERSGHMKNWKMATLAAAFCLSTVSWAGAEPNAKPCADDVANFCKGVQPGQGHLAQCLKQHSNELSPACKDDLKIKKEKFQDFVQACKADEEKLCSDIKPGRGRIVRCLKQHESELSAECKERVEQPKGRQ